MAKKVILKDLKGTEVLPITRGELVIDSSGKQALHSNEFLATTSLPGLMSATDKNKLDNFQGDTYELSGGISDDKYITTLTSSKGVTTNAVIEPMQGATVDLAGKVGLVPAPLAGYQNKFLSGDGTWKSPEGTSITAEDILEKLKTVDGAGSGLDADLLDGIHSSSIFHARKTLVDGNNINTTLENGVYYTSGYAPVSSAYRYGTLLCFRSGDVGVNSRQTQFYISDGRNSGIIYYRNAWNSTSDITTVWHRLARVVDNVASASKLKTPRTIWGQPFDGTADVSGNLTLDNNRFITAKNTSGTARWILGLGTDNALHLGGDTAAIGYDTVVYGNNIQFRYGTSKIEGIRLTSSGNVLIGTTTDSGYKLDVKGIVHSSLAFDLPYSTGNGAGITFHGKTVLRASSGGTILSSPTGDTQIIYIRPCGTDNDSYASSFDGNGGFNLAKKLTIDGIPIYKKQDGVLYIKGNLETQGNVKATSFIGNLDGTYVNALTGYTKATSAVDLTATDTLNAALGKLEYKADTAYDWIISVTTEDTDKYVNKWQEILDFLNKIDNTDGADLTDEFVTRKTDLDITGTKTFTSKIYISSSSDHKLILNNTLESESKIQGIRFQQNGVDYGLLGTWGSDDLEWNRKNILHSGNSSVTKSGQTLTVTINGNSQSLTNSTYNFSGASFNSGNKDAAEHDANNITSNGVWYYTANGPATSLGASTNDGALYSQAYNPSWVGQIAQDYRDGDLFTRGRNSGTWTAWKRVAYANDIPTSLKNPNAIKFKKPDDTIVSYDGSSEVDLTGGIRFAKSTHYLASSSSNITTTPDTGMIIYSRMLGENRGNLPGDNNANGVITINTHQGNYNHLLGFSSKGFYYRYFNSNQLNTTTNWSTIYHSGNLTNVSQLNNDSGYVTGGPYLPLTGGILAGTTDTPLVLRGNTISAWIAYLDSSGTHLGSIGVRNNSPVFYHKNINNNAYTIIWHSGNDGSGSGLDADLLDGKHASHFATAADYVTLGTSQTITGLKHFNTNTNSVPLIISRTGSTSESVKIGVNDSQTIFDYTNDETSCSYIFKMTNTDTERGNGNSNTSSVVFSGNSSGATVTANKFVGNLNHTLTFSVGTFTAKTYNNSAAVTINIPTKTSHLTNDSNFFTVTAIPKNTDINTLKGTTLYYIDTDGNTGTLTNAPYTKSFAMLLLKGYESGDNLRRYRLAIDDCGAARLFNDRDTANTGGAWVDVLTSKNSGISGNGGNTWGSSVTIKINGVEKTLTIPANPNVDTKVTLTNTTGSANYRVLFSATADDTTRTEGARKSTKLLFNPSSGLLTATGFVKSGSSDSYVLLGGGGHKALSDFAMASAYVKKAGDTMTGTLTMSTGAAIHLWDDSASTSHRLTLRNASDVGRIYNYTGSAYGAMYVGHDGTNAIVITSGLNVGIGTGNPSDKFHVNGGQIRSTHSSKYLRIGPQNSSHAHYETDAGSHWFNKQVEVYGHVNPYNNNSFTSGTSSKRWNNVYSVSGNFTADILLGTGGTYNIGQIVQTTDSSLGYLFEGALASDSSGASRLPITLTWRGGYSSKGGLQILDSSHATLGGNAIIHAGNWPSYIGGDGFVMRCYVIDARSLNTSTWYPVTMDLGWDGRVVRIEVRCYLLGNKPSWATHAAGFTTIKVWETHGYGWGSASGAYRTIYQSNSSWCDPDPVRGIGLMGNSNQEFVYVRGGGYYYFYTSHNTTPVLRTSTFSQNNESVGPTTSMPSGIGAFSTSYNMHASHFYEHSDIRFKDVEEDVNISPQQLSKLPLFNFKWNNKHDNEVHTGSSALEVQKLLPTIVHENNDILTLDYGVLGTVAGITACRELTKHEQEIQKLQNRISELEEKIENFKNKN